MIRFALSRNDNQEIAEQETTLSPIRRVLSSPFRRRHGDDAVDINVVKRKGPDTNAVKSKGLCAIPPNSDALPVAKKQPVLAPTHRVLPPLRPEQPTATAESNLTRLTKSISNLLHQPEQAPRKEALAPARKAAGSIHSPSRRRRRSVLGVPAQEERVSLSHHLGKATIPRRASTGSDASNLLRGSFSSLSSSPSLNSTSTGSPLILPSSRRQGPLNDMLDREHEHVLHRQEDLLGVSEHVLVPKTSSHAPLNSPTKKRLKKKTNDSNKAKTTGFKQSAQRHGKANVSIQSALSSNGKEWSIQGRPTHLKKSLSVSGSSFQIDPIIMVNRRSCSERNLLKKSASLAASPRKNLSDHILDEHRLSTKLNKSASQASPRKHSSDHIVLDRRLSKKLLTPQNKRQLSSRKLGERARTNVSNSPKSATLEKRKTPIRRMSEISSPKGIAQSLQSPNALKRSHSTTRLRPKESPYTPVGHNSSLYQSPAQKQRPSTRNRRTSRLSPTVQAAPYMPPKKTMIPAAPDLNIVLTGRLASDRRETASNDSPLSPSITTKGAAFPKRKRIKSTKTIASNASRPSPKKAKPRRASMMSIKSNETVPASVCVVQPRRSGSLRDLRIKSRDGPSLEFSSFPKLDDETEHDLIEKSPRSVLERVCPEHSCSSTSWGDLTCEADPFENNNMRGNLKSTFSSTSWGDLSLGLLAASALGLTSQNNCASPPVMGKQLAGEAKRKPRRGRRPKSRDSPSVSENSSSGHTNKTASGLKTKPIRTRKISSAVPKEACALSSPYSKRKTLSDDNSASERDL